MTFKVVSYNIQYGFGFDGTYDLDRIVATIREADIVCLQEVTRFYVKNGGVDMVGELRAALPEHFSVYQPAADVDMASALVAGRAVNRRFQFGNMVLSRWPILASRAHLLPRTQRTEALNLQRGALETSIETPAGPVRFYSVHLDHIGAGERLSQVRALRAIALDFGRTGGAITGASDFGLPDLEDAGDFVLMGDFNCEPDSDEYALMVEDGAIVDVTAGDPGWSWRTWEKDNPDKRERLDYAFCNRALAGRITDGQIDRQATGSDHMPVWITVNG